MRQTYYPGELKGGSGDRAMRGGCGCWAHLSYYPVQLSASILPPHWKLGLCVSANGYPGLGTVCNPVNIKEIVVGLMPSISPKF